MLLSYSHSEWNPNGFLHSSVKGCLDIFPFYFTATLGHLTILVYRETWASLYHGWENFSRTHIEELNFWVGRHIYFLLNRTKLFFKAISQQTVWKYRFAHHHLTFQTWKRYFFPPLVEYTKVPSCFNLYLKNYERGWTSFCDYWHLGFFCKLPMRFLGPFSHWVVFFLLVCADFLHILTTNPFSIAYITAVCSVCDEIFSFVNRVSCSAKVFNMF